MITKLKIANFKSHKETELNIGNLTLLTGLNSTGKSSVIQIFLLLRQSFKKGRLSKGLDLNEPLCDIGKGVDALYRFANESEIISFEIEIDKKQDFTFNFDAKDKYDETFIPHLSEVLITEEQSELPFFTNNFQYLSANRIAGIEFYPLDSYAVEEEKQISRNYGQGELVAHFLEFYGENRDFDIELDLLLHPESSSRKLLDQVIAWEREISPRITMMPTKKGDKVIIEYGYKSKGDFLPIENLKSKNIGFGISYSLSIIVALLSAEPGALILIENPEAHLHPKGQSKLAELICLAAQSGIQVIVETHSDHIFNGLRKGIHSNKIKKEEAKVYYFETNDQNTSICTEIEFSDKGRIMNYKHGFFDQFDNDLDTLLDL
jgi:predicted ATPase